jgi:hypothetical protein
MGESGGYSPSATASRWANPGRVDGGDNALSVDGDDREGYTKRKKKSVKKAS